MGGQPEIISLSVGDRTHPTASLDFKFDIISSPRKSRITTQRGKFGSQDCQPFFGGLGFRQRTKKANNVIRYLGRQETIDRYKREHEKLKRLVSSLPEEQVLKPNTLGKWSIKDIVAHLAAWNWEATDEVDRVLSDKAMWPARYEDKVGEDEFNRKEVEKRKNRSWGEVLKDWDNSFWAQIKRMENLTEDGWKHQSGNRFWSDSTPVTVYLLFAYEYEGEGHEGGHAEQIKERLNL